MIACPKCGKSSASVDSITLKALLTPDGLRRGVPSEPRYCATETCPVVYFDAQSGVTFAEADLIVSVYAKHANDPALLVCYCFGVAHGAIAGVDAERATMTRQMVAHEVQAGHCACEVKNPKGRCCLGDLVRIEHASARNAAERRQIADAIASLCCVV